jgi:hypothetical protein
MTSGDTRHGPTDDPRMVLIGVAIRSAEFLEGTSRDR